MVCRFAYVYTYNICKSSPSHLEKNIKTMSKEGAVQKRQQVVLFKQNAARARTAENNHQRKKIENKGTKKVNKNKMDL